MQTLLAELHRHDDPRPARRRRRRQRRPPADQGAELRLDRHHDGLGRRRRDGGLRRRPHQRRAPQSRRHDRAGGDRQLPVGAGARLHRRADARRLPRRRARVARLPAALARTPDPGRSSACSAPRPAIRHTAANCICEVIGTAVLVFGILAIAANAQTLSQPGDVDLSFVFSRGLAAAARRRARARHRPLARRPDRLRDQPRARPRPAPRARDPADRRQGLVRLGYAGSRSSARSSAASPAPGSTPSIGF